MMVDNDKLMQRMLPMVANEKLQKLKKKQKNETKYKLATLLLT
jgi:hypothetical protein